MSEIVDRRVRKTRKQLRQVLAELLQTKPLKNISVREISDLADINRGTFYLHYKDIYDMIEQIEQEMFAEFTAIIDKHQPTNLQPTPYPLLLDIFNYLADNKDMCAVLLSKNGDADFVDKLKNSIMEKFLANFPKIASDKDAANNKFSRYYYSFIAFGSIGIFQMWLDGNMQESADEMAQLAGAMITGGISAIR
jgi:AcrR family transcriptional regulator